MSKYECTKCKSTNTRVKDFNYLGEWSNSVIVCLDCGNQTTKYYDLFINTNTEIYQEVTAQETTQDLCL